MGAGPCLCDYPAQASMASLRCYHGCGNGYQDCMASATLRLLPGTSPRHSPIVPQEPFKWPLTGTFGRRPLEMLLRGFEAPIGIIERKGSRGSRQAAMIIEFPLLGSPKALGRTRS